MAAAFVALAWFALPYAIPLPPGLVHGPGGSPVVMDRHGAPVHHLTFPDSSRSRPVPLAEIPPDLIACTLAAEDKRFHRHGGIDFSAIARASRDLVVKRRVVSGASTITQQLAKISGPPRSRSIPTKIRENLVARRLEMTWPKEKILEAYFQRLDYGNLRIGPAEAARFYFQKPLTDLSLAECALLAGLPQAPSRLNPLRHPGRALVRRDTVLQRLGALHPEDAARIATASSEPLSLRPLRETRPAPWLAGDLFRPPPGSTGRTTLDLALQLDVEAIVREEISKLRHANVRHAAVVVLHNPTREILALVSSADWKDPRGGQFNGALTPRSPGSALKPFTYLLALRENHRTPASILADIPTPFRTPQGLDLPENYDRNYRGPVTLRQALACSLNIPALRELDALGGPEILHDFLAGLGIRLPDDGPGFHGLGLTLGNAPVRLLDLANAYATLARLGEHRPPVLYFPQQSLSPPDPLFDARSAWLIADILADSDARAPSFPPGGPLDLPFPCAVKTGTSSDFRDNWCIGFTAEFTVGVWAGNFEHQPMKGISGVAGAGPVFQRTMTRLHRDRPPAWLERPAGLVEISIDPRNGKRTATSASGPRRSDFAPAENLPPFATPEDYDASGKALIPAEYAAWFAGAHNTRRGELSLHQHLVSAEPLRIIAPRTGSTFLLDPEIPSGSGKLRPVTNLPGTARWSSETLHIEPGDPEPLIHLVPGSHTIIATDPRTGSRHPIHFHVRNF